jgi:hypothetical protein
VVDHLEAIVELHPQEAAEYLRRSPKPRSGKSELLSLATAKFPEQDFGTETAFGLPVSGARFSSRPPTDSGFTSAHGLIGTILEADTESRRAICNRSRYSLQNVDEQTEDAQHEEQREQ